MKKNCAVVFFSFLLFLTLSFSVAPAFAQCAMCKSSVESNQASSDMTKMEKFGKGLNKGILYIMAAPYILVGTVGYFWYRNSRKNK
jgi:hypothetical protein